MRIIKLTEGDLAQIVKKVLSEQGSMFGTAGTEIPGYRKDDTRNAPRKPVTNTKENINPLNLKLGDGGTKNSKQIPEVNKLQAKLIQLGLLATSTGKPTGFFGELTQKALNRYNDPKYIPGQLSVPTPEKKTGGTPIKGGPVPKTKAVKQAAECETGTENVLIPNASLSFDGDKLIWLVNGKAVKSWGAVSGLTWKNTPINDYGKLVNRFISSRQEWSKQKDAGPLPEGQYSVGPLETRSGQPEEIGAIEAFWHKFIARDVSDKDADRAFCKNTLLSRISWGNYRLRITPTGGQKMYSRGDFYVHGGSLEGSHGCIDLTDDMDDFAKFFTIWSTTNGKKTIPLVVKYKNPQLNQIIQKLVNL